MAFSFDTFRNLFTGHKPEQTQPSFTPASGREIKPDVDKIMASVDTASLSELQKHDQTLIDRFNFITQDGRFPREARELSETIGRLYSTIQAQMQRLEVHQADQAVLSGSTARGPMQESVGWDNEYARESFAVHVQHLWYPEGLSENAGDSEYAQVQGEAEQFVKAYEAENPALSSVEAYEKFRVEQNAEREGLEEQEMSRQNLLNRLEASRQDQAEISPTGEHHLSHEQQAQMDLRQLEQENPGLSYTELLEHHKTIEAQNAAAPSATTIGTDNLLDLLRSQEENIRQEWRNDLATGRQNEHDLETYFAGKVDQHNTLIELAVEANPKLQETLPPQINYEQLRTDLQQQTQQQKQQEVPAQAMAMEMAI